MSVRERERKREREGERERRREGERGERVATSPARSHSRSLNRHDAVCQLLDVRVRDKDVTSHRCELVANELHVLERFSKRLPAPAPSNRLFETDAREAVGLHRDPEAFHDKITHEARHVAHIVALRDLDVVKLDERGARLPNQPTHACRRGVQCRQRRERANVFYVSVSVECSCDRRFALSSLETYALRAHAVHRSGGDALHRPLHHDELNPGHA